MSGVKYNILRIIQQIFMFLTFPIAAPTCTRTSALNTCIFLFAATDIFSELGRTQTEHNKVHKSLTRISNDLYKCDKKSEAITSFQNISYYSKIPLSGYPPNRQSCKILSIFIITVYIPQL